MSGEEFVLGGSKLRLYIVDSPHESHEVVGEGGHQGSHSQRESVYRCLRVIHPLVCVRSRRRGVSSLVFGGGCGAAFPSKEDDQSQIVCRDWSRERGEASGGSHPLLQYCVAFVGCVFYDRAY